jgi:DNA-binding transcriptional ArsR family regulator
MLNKSAPLDRTFQALADATRRAILAELTRGPSSVNKLAGPLAMSLPAVMQHLAVLEESGLSDRRRSGGYAPVGLKLMLWTWRSNGSINDGWSGNDTSTAWANI